VRTILTILAILLGVSIFLGTSIAAESVQYSLNYQVTKQFGYTDIIIIDKDNPYTNSIPLDKIKEELKNISGLNYEWTYQMRQYNIVTPYKGIRTSFSYWWPFVGINASAPLESKFGAVEINESIDENLKTLEALLITPLISNSCVITRLLAETYNLTVGQSLYVYPSQPWPSIDWTNSSTWLNLTITGIINDKGKSFAFFYPPITEIWQLRPPEFAVYVDIGVAQKYIFNNNPNDVNLLLIHAKNIQSIDSTIETVLAAFNSSSDLEIKSIKFYGFNLKSFFQDQISGMFTLFSAILALFSGISLLVCGILIKNLIEVAKEEQMEEIGIMRAIGISKIGVFRIYLTQISVMAVIGAALGLILGYLISFLFLGPLKMISLAMNVDLFSFFSSDFEIFVVVTSFSLILSLGVGIGLSMLFGMIPAISAVNVKVIKALNPQMTEEI
jgi:ABC-type antimicrobial peptide transport system permease subunit